jgi:uncharacterized protein with NAD-binding domain and iron-sulfur cluster
MAAAFELTRPALRGRYDVTVYQMGWRLGGKGASGRGPHGRIEEHGLHLWMGYYENAFRLMRECYAELERDPAKVRIARWSDAFFPANFNAVMDWSPSGQWLPWVVNFAPTPGLPGDPGAPRWSVADYMARAAGLLRTLLQTLGTSTPSGPRREDLFPEIGPEPITAETLSDAFGRLLRYGALAGLGAAVEAVQVLEGALRMAPVFPQSLLSQFFDAIEGALRARLSALTEKDDGVRRLWEVVDLLLAVLRGGIRFRLIFDPRGFDAIDDYDSREWLRLNGASPGSIDSAFMRSLYDLAFAYEGGNPDRPSIAAGSALRGALRAFFTYRGAFFWKMRAGMGDIVFAPLYEVLRRRGVRFEFFHKLARVRLSPREAGGDPHVTALDFEVQARTRDGAEYRPLVDVQGLPCWPSQPDYGQLVDGDQIRSEAWDLESQWDDRRSGERTVHVAEDFDMVVLGVPVGTVPYVCQEILERDERWRDMVEHVKSVPTQAFQVWLDRDARGLGWKGGQVNISGFVEPFDTWADMTHLGTEEAWPSRPGSIAYFCNVLEDVRGGAAPGFVESEYERVRANAVRFLDGDVAHLWPASRSTRGSFCWDSLLGADGRPSDRADPSSFGSQFWTANVRPSDRYSQALPGSARYRISPLDRAYDNLTVAGDWTRCGLNMGCVEAAVMSGMLAAHAIAESPRLSDIVGYDHP